MASIKKYKTGWRAWVSKKGQRTSRTFITKAEAIAWANGIEERIDAPVTGRYTLHMALDKFAEEEAPKRKGERWEVIRCNKLKREMPDCLMRELNAQYFAAWRDAQVKLRAPSSVRREMNLIKSVLDVARKEWGWIEASPLEDVRRPPNAKSRKRGIAQKEIDAIVESLGWEPWLRVERRNDEVAVGFLICIETALRSGELLGLAWGDVDLDARVLTVRDTKNGDDREVPLSTRAVQLFGCLSRESERCFQISPAVRDVLFRAARDAAGCREVHFHDSRSEGISRLSKKLDVLELARVTGHRDLKSLLHYYRADTAALAQRLG